MMLARIRATNNRDEVLTLPFIVMRVLRPVLMEGMLQVGNNLHLLFSNCSGALPQPPNRPGACLTEEQPTIGKRMLGWGNL